MTFVKWLIFAVTAYDTVSVNEGNGWPPGVTVCDTHFSQNPPLWLKWVSWTIFFLFSHF